MKSTFYYPAFKGGAEKRTEIYRTFVEDDQILPAMPSTEMTRFDTRISKAQKEYLEKAARLGGYKTLSEFILSSAKNVADGIIEKHDQILASQADQELFFQALLKPGKPTARLKKAVQRYKEHLKK